MDFGSLASGALSGNTLSMSASFVFTSSTPGSGFYGQFILGDPPGPSAGGASQLQFVHAAAALGGSAAGSMAMARQTSMHAATSLAMPSHATFA